MGGRLSTRNRLPRLVGYLEEAKASKDAEILCGGNCNGEEGYFVEPTVIVTTDPKYKTMCEEIFGPVLTVFVYDDGDFEKTLQGVRLHITVWR